MRAPAQPRGRLPLCGDGQLQPRAYAYLLGLYLGDGHISLHRRGVYHLRITLDARYGQIVAEAAQAMALVAHGRRIGLQPAPGCIVVGSYWKHWPCLFPQYGPGAKHTRPIKLDDCQLDILRSEAALLRGLIHSDGCRVLMGPKR